MEVRFKPVEYEVIDPDTAPPRASGPRCWKCECCAPEPDSVKMHAEMPAERKGTYLAASTIYRDDAEYLPEWIEFHRLVGVERFFLYDNGSTTITATCSLPTWARGP